MSFSWKEDVRVAIERPSPVGWLLVAIRAPLIALTIFGLMIPLFVLRSLGFERAGQYIVQFACKVSLFIMGLRLRVSGTPMEAPGGVVANHSSWLDIFTLNAAQRVYFVSKDDVSAWPAIGVVARSTGTVFIRRKTTDAAKQKRIFADRLGQGHRLLFFPEGTSTDGRRVLPFRSSLFAAFFDLGNDAASIQPVSVTYNAPSGKPEDVYGWWGDMSFFGHFVLVLAMWKQGHVDVVLHPPLKIADYASRKALATAAEADVRRGVGFEAVKTDAE